MTWAIVIPARMSSTRFPGKPLIDLHGKPMIQWVYEAARESGLTETIVIATPDPEIAKVAKEFGAEARLTSPDCPSGTDRIAEIAQQMNVDAFLNVQGDEPLIPPSDLVACAKALTSEADVATLVTAAREQDLGDPAVVKVVVGQNGQALYFSRAAIPYARHDRRRPPLRHLGLYAYRREAVLAFAQLPPGDLEQSEGLEQLRFLENGYRIFVGEGQGSAIAVDTPTQAEEVRTLLAKRYTFR